MPSRRFRASLVALAAVMCASVTACAAVPDDDAEEQTLTVFAAASLTEVFTQIADEFEASHPGVEVTLSFAGSSTLAQQVIEGAPADVLATANEATMAQVSDVMEIEPLIFASNTLTIAVPEGNPAGITGITDLTREDVRLVVCAPQVPCGTATETVERATRVALSPVSEESNVTDVLGKVASGEADAGIVYVTDIARADGVAQVDLEGSDVAVNLYPIAALPRDGDAPTMLADEFVAAVLSDASREILESAGFTTP